MAQMMEQGRQERIMSIEMQDCIADLRLCSASCWDTLNYCLNKGERHSEPSHIMKLIDCAEVCQTALGFVNRDSEFMEHILQACSEICEKCADDCETFKDDHMSQCASVCRRCSESCSKMLTS